MCGTGCPPAAKSKLNLDAPSKFAKNSRKPFKNRAIGYDHGRFATWTAGRSVKLTRQSPEKPNDGAGTGDENQKSVKAATFGAQNQCASPLASIAHQRVPFGASFQSILACMRQHSMLGNSQVAWDIASFDV